MENPEFPSVCPCKRRKCPRHGDCAACTAHHRNNRYPVYCRRGAATPLSKSAADAPPASGRPVQRRNAANAEEAAADKPKK